MAKAKKKIAKTSSAKKVKPKKTAAKKKVVKKSVSKKTATKKAVSKKTQKPVKKTVKKPVKKILKTIVKKSVKKPVKKTVQKAAQKVAQKTVQKPQVVQATQPKIKMEQFITPLDDRIIAEVVKGEKRTAGGLYIPETAQVSGNFKARVLAAGRGHKDKKGRVRPMDVQTGDWILFSEYSGQPIELMGKEYLLLRESDVLGIVTNS